jgi:hypothetical protein
LLYRPKSREFKDVKKPDLFSHVKESAFMGYPNRCHGTNDAHPDALRYRMYFDNDKLPYVLW